MLILLQHDHLGGNLVAGKVAFAGFAEKNISPRFLSYFLQDEVHHFADIVQVHNLLHGESEAEFLLDGGNEADVC